MRSPTRTIRFLLCAVFLVTGCARAGPRQIESGDAGDASMGPDGGAGVDGGTSDGSVDSSDPEDAADGSIQVDAGSDSGEMPDAGDVRDAGVSSDAGADGGKADSGGGTDGDAGASPDDAGPPDAGEVAVGASITEGTGTIAVVQSADAGAVCSSLLPTAGSDVPYYEVIVTGVDACKPIIDSEMHLAIAINDHGVVPSAVEIEWRLQPPRSDDRGS